MNTIQSQCGQLFMVGFHGLTAPDYILEWLSEGKIGGVILFARNVDTPEQLIALTTSLHQSAKIKPLIAIDQEGGAVARLRHGFIESPGALALASSGENRIEFTERASHILADELNALGINWTFAPVLDIAYNNENPTIGTRSFGADVETVSVLGAAAVRGFQSGGVAACAKHFPGLGDTAIDTHQALSILATPLKTLQAVDLVPYQAAIADNLASIMTTHTIFSELDPEYPATLSPNVIQMLIREELNFQGVVISDCMEMKAILDHHSPAEFTKNGILAGLDMVLISHTQSIQSQAYDGLLQAVNDSTISPERIEASYQRIIALKNALPEFAPDISRIVTPQNQKTMLEIAYAGIRFIRDDISIRMDIRNRAKKIVLVEFIPTLDTDVLEDDRRFPLTNLIKSQLPHIKTIMLDPATEFDLSLVESSLSDADVAVFATHDARLSQVQSDLLATLISLAPKNVLVSLCHPNDAFLAPSADVMLITNGDSHPSLQAVTKILADDEISPI